MEDMCWRCVCNHSISDHCQTAEDGYLPIKAAMHLSVPLHCTICANGLSSRAGGKAAASPSGRQPTTESAEKLDALMGLVFEHLGRRCEAGQLPAAWATTLHTFQRTILHTHRSKFTQYLLWYLCEKARPLRPSTCQSCHFLRFLLLYVIFLLSLTPGCQSGEPIKPCCGSRQAALLGVQDNNIGAAWIYVTSFLRG